MKHLILAAALAALGCSMTAPLTRKEFIDAVDKGKGPAKAGTYMVARAFNDVFKTLAANSTKCLDKTVKRSGGAAGAAHASSTRYVPNISRPSPGKAAFSLQVLHHPRGVGVKQPDDGVYVMAADVSSVDGKKTKVDVWYATWGYSQIVDGFE